MKKMTEYCVRMSLVVRCVFVSSACVGVAVVLHDYFVYTAKVQGNCVNPA